MENRPTRPRRRATEAARQPSITILPEPYATEAAEAVPTASEAALRADAGPAAMGPEATFRRMTELLNARQFADLGHLLAPSLVDHDRWPGQLPGADGFRSALAGMLEAFPDARLEPEEVLVAGDRAVYTIVFTGTHEGEALGIAPTGRAVRVRGLGMVRVADGRITDSWGGLDLGSLLDQLGAGPWNQEPAPEPDYGLM